MTVFNSSLYPVVESFKVSIQTVIGEPLDEVRGSGIWDFKFYGFTNGFTCPITISRKCDDKIIYVNLQRASIIYDFASHLLKSATNYVNLLLAELIFTFHGCITMGKSVYCSQR